MSSRGYTRAAAAADHAPEQQRRTAPTEREAVVFNCAVLGEVMLASAVALAAYMFALWALSVPLRDVSIVDPAWPLGFVAVSWLAFAIGDGSSGRRLLLALLVSLWGARLGGYLIARKLRERREDPRYADMRSVRGAGFLAWSLGGIFLTQGALIFVVSLPVQGAAARAAGLGALDWIGVAVWVVGMFFEAVGDAQLARFKGDERNRGGIMREGLWRYTRHPNYFGDFAVWWGIYLVALSAGAWWAIAGPAVMSVLLIRVSGRDLLEKRMRDRPGYAEYASRTSSFFPLPPRGSSR
jgi:steroid 5-alpha reductase family enzyme